MRLINLRIEIFALKQRYPYNKTGIVFYPIQTLYRIR